MPVTSAHRSAYALRISATQVWSPWIAATAAFWAIALTHDVVGSWARRMWRTISGGPTM